MQNLKIWNPIWKKKLTHYASRGYDVADIWGKAAGKFRNLKNYEAQDKEFLIKNAVFDVNIER